MNEERIVVKIQKLLAVANDNRGNEQERETALRQAHALLVKHNLDMEDIPAAQRTEPRIKHAFATWSQPWARLVLGSVARLFFCRYVQSSKINATKMHHIYVGKEGNATTAALVGEFVVTSILAEARRLTGENLSPAARSFCLGAAEKIQSRVADMIAGRGAEVEQVSSGRELVVLNLYTTENEENGCWMAANMKTRAIKTRMAGANDLEMHGAGQAFGGKVSFVTQVGGAAPMRRLT